MGSSTSKFNPWGQASLIICISLILGLLFNYFFYDALPGITFPIYVMTIILGLYIIAAILKQQINRQVFWLIAPLLFFSVMVFIRASTLLTFLNIAGSLLILLLITEASFGQKLTNFYIKNYVSISFLPFRFIRPLFLSLSDFFSLRGINKNQKHVTPVLRGILMAIPFLLIFLWLFSSADLIFNKYVSDLFSFDIPAEMLSRAFIILMATLLSIGAYSYIFTRTENELAPEQIQRPALLAFIEGYVFLGLINALFFVFIIVQITYLFGGQNHVMSQGFTYADYARHGFVELIGVAIISLALLLSTDKSITKKDNQHALGFKILSSALVIQVVVIMVSAFMRLSLYEAAYGFTTLRLYSHAFIIFLAVIFFLLLYKILLNRQDNFFAFSLFLAITLFLVAMNFMNPDTFIAKQNIARYKVSGKLDIYYLGYLSDDAIPEAIKILNIPDKDLRSSFGRQMHNRFQNEGYFDIFEWRSLNISQLRAHDILTSKSKELEQYKDYQEADLPSVYED